MTDDTGEAHILIAVVEVEDGQDAYAVWMKAQETRHDTIGARIEAQIAARADKKPTKRK